MKSHKANENDLVKIDNAVSLMMVYGLQIWIYRIGDRYKNDIDNASLREGGGTQSVTEGDRGTKVLYRCRRQIAVDSTYTAAARLRRRTDFDSTAFSSSHLR